MGGIVFGSIMLGVAFGWRADILAHESGTDFVWPYLLGGLGFGMLVGGVIDAIAERIAGRSVGSMFRPRARVKA